MHQASRGGQMRLLASVPARMVGSVAYLARREVRSWTKKNETIRSLRYGWFRRALIEGTDHPLLFCLLLAEIVGIVGFVVSRFPWSDDWLLSGPDFSEFNLVEFAGMPLGVQVTLVALVYPIVLSFTALMLQRKAQSALALQVYLIESGVVPAGASSIGLLLVLGVLYFCIPYAGLGFLIAHATMTIVACGVWLLMNVLLTGFFLVRTIRFLQESEQRHAYIRVAVDLALREDLIKTAKQYVLAHAPKVRWAMPDKDEQTPTVRMFSWRDNGPVLIKTLKEKRRLHDVRLGLLGLVVRSWLRRARNWPKTKIDSSAVLSFPALTDRVYENRVKLCMVENGPPLTFLDKQLIRCAHVFRSERANNPMTSQRMLEELAGQVVQAADQRRFTEANEMLRAMFDVHHTLLLASAIKGQNGREFAATLSVSLNSWGARSYANEWLGAYRDVCRIAVDCMEDDDSLFRYVAHLPFYLFNRLPARPEVLLIDALQIGTSLDGLLEEWWLKRSDEKAVESGSEGLPASTAKRYEGAITNFVGAWSNVRVDVPGGEGADDLLQWHELSGRILVYLSHFEDTAFMYMRAVARKDEVAASWYLDEFLKWWGGRAIELKLPQHPSDFYLRDVTVDIVELSWPEAQEALRTDDGLPNIDFAALVLNLALRRHWESMRVYLALLLIHKTRVSPQEDSMELRHAASLLMGVGLHPGGRVEASNMRSTDQVLTKFLVMNFGSRQLSARIERFSERLRNLRAGPRISGRIYSFRGELDGFSSLRAAMGIVLTSLVSPDSVTRRLREGQRHSQEIIERGWRDVDRLREVRSFLGDLRRDMLSADRTEFRWTVHRLREQIHRVSQGSANFVQERTAAVVVTNMLKRLQAVCLYERDMTLRASDVDPTKIRALGVLVSALVFESSSKWFPFTGVCFNEAAGERTLKIPYSDNRKDYLTGNRGEADRHAAEQMRDAIREYSIQEAVADVITRLSLSPIASPGNSDYAALTEQEATAFLLDVVQACSNMSSKGKTPVVLVDDHSLARYLLSPSRWGAHSWQTPLPPGVVVDKHTDAADAALSIVNGVEIFACSTPGDAVYVVPQQSLGHLSFQGEGPGKAISTTWKEESAEHLTIDFSWTLHAQLDASP